MLLRFNAIGTGRLLCVVVCAAKQTALKWNCFFTFFGKSLLCILIWTRKWYRLTLHLPLVGKIAGSAWFNIDLDSMLLFYIGLKLHTFQSIGHGLNYIKKLKNSTGRLTQTHYFCRERSQLLALKHSLLEFSWKNCSFVTATVPHTPRASLSELNVNWHRNQWHRQN